MAACKSGRHIFQLAVLLASLSCPGQTLAQESCASALHSADDKFRRRKNDEAIALITLCLQKSGFTTEEQVTAHILLARIYQVKMQLDSAEVQLQLLWRIVPGWRASLADFPPEFCEFVEEVHRRTIVAPPKGLEPKTAVVNSNPAGLDTTTFHDLPDDSEDRPAVIRPETVVLGLFDVNAGVATLWQSSSVRDERNPLLGHVRLGFEFAELEFRRIEILNKNTFGQKELTTGAVKLHLPAGALLPDSLALCGIFRNSLSIHNEDKLENSDYDYSKSYRSFTLLLSKNFRWCQVQAGPSFNSLSMCQIDPSKSPAENDSLCAAEHSSARRDSKGIIFAPTIALQALIKSYIQATASLYPVPRYGKPSDVFVKGDSKEELAVRYSLSVGMNVSPARLLAFHVGSILPLSVKPKEVWRNNEFRITLGVTFGVSFTETFHKLRQAEK